MGHFHNARERPESFPPPLVHPQREIDDHYSISVQPTGATYYGGKSGRGKVKFPEVNAFARGKLNGLDVRLPLVATVGNFVAV